ncbi:MAG TPA: transcriptional repressor [Candidatus Acidoferrales bacterium]|jgi:Fe2+ or Zn2+ uptake regulation protein|nr:transcriptional repressor [Candidatus Acidoferrales bacterium]
MTEITISPDAETGLSKNHRLVYQIVLEQGVGTHLSMTQLFELARTRQPAIGFTTVYRALTRLRDAGLVAEINLPGAECAVYEPMAPPHAHFRCTVCARVVDVPYTISDGVSDQLGNENGFMIERSEVAFSGHCATCHPAALRSG